MSPWGTRTTRVIDVVLLVWIGTWIWLGIAIGHQVSELTTLSDTVVTAGRAVQVTGQSLQSLEGLPFGIGDRVAGVHRQIEAAGTSAVASGERSRGAIATLAALLTVAIAVIPSVPVLALYVPFRVSRMWDVRTIRRAGRRAASEPAFEEFLARRASQHLSYHRLREITPNPWRDLEEGRFGPLARAELERMGLNRLARRLRVDPGMRADGVRPRAVTR